MACSSCKDKKKGIGSLSKEQNAELVEACYIALGAVGSKILVNPLVKTLFKPETKYSPSITKLLIAGGLYYMGEDWSKAAAKGAAGVAVMEWLDAYNPDLFKATKLLGGKAEKEESESPPQKPAGVLGGIILDLDNYRVNGSGGSYSGSNYRMGNYAQDEHEPGRSVTLAYMPS